MAKNDDFEDDIDLSFDGMDEWEMDDFDGQSKDKKDKSINKKDRKAIDVIKDAGKETKQFIQDKQLIQKMVKGAMPEELNVAGESLADLLNSTKDAVSEGMSSIGKEYNEVRKNLSKIAGYHDKLIPKKVKEYLDNYKKEEPSYSSREETLEDKIKKDMEEVFGAQLEMQRQQGEQEIVRDQIEKKRFETQQDLLHHIRRSTHISARYTTEVASRYQRKNLELGIRQVSLQTSILKTLMGMSEHQKTTLDAVVKNTALPDIVKAHKSEVIKEMGFRNLVELSSKGFSSFFNGYQDQLKKNIVDAVKGSLGGIKDGLNMAGSLADPYLMQKEMEEDFGGGESMGRQIGGMISGSIVSKISKKYIAPRLMRGGKSAAILNKALRLSGNLPTALNRLKDNSNNPIVDMLSSLLPGGSESYKKHQFESKTKLKDLAQFDVATRKSIVDIIPQLLAKIHQSTEGIRLGQVGNLDDGHLLEWDHNQAQLSTRNALDEKYQAEIQSKLRVKNQYDMVKAIVNVIDPTRSLTNKARKALTHEIFERGGDYKGFDPKDFVDTHGWRTRAHEHVKEEVASFLIDTFGLVESETEYGVWKSTKEYDAETQLKLREASTYHNRFESLRGDAQNQVLNDSTISSTDAQRAARLGYGQLDENGTFSITKSKNYYTDESKRGISLSRKSFKTLEEDMMYHGENITREEFRTRKGYDKVSQTIPNPWGKDYLDGRRLTFQEYDRGLNDPRAKMLDKEYMRNPARIKSWGKKLWDRLSKASDNEIKAYKEAGSFEAYAETKRQEATEQATQAFNKAKEKVEGTVADIMESKPVQRVVNDERVQSTVSSIQSTAQAATTKVVNSEQYKTAVEKVNALKEKKAQVEKELGVKINENQQIQAALEWIDKEKIADTLASSKESLVTSAVQTYVELTGEEPGVVAEKFKEDPKEAIKHLRDLGIPLSPKAGKQIEAFAKEKQAKIKEVAKNVQDNIKEKGVKDAATDGLSALGSIIQAQGAKLGESTIIKDLSEKGQLGILAATSAAGVAKDKLGSKYHDLLESKDFLRDLHQRAMGFKEKSRIPDALRNMLGIFNRHDDEEKKVKAEFLQQVVDVYVKDEEEPRLQAIFMKQGYYFQKVDGKPITCIGDINNEVIDKEGNLVLSKADLKKGIETIHREPIPTQYRPAEFILPVDSRSLERKIINTVGATMRSTDVYTKDNLETPAISRWAMIMGRYHNSKGKPIYTIKDIDGTVYDKDGNVIISEEQIQAGLVDKKGRPLRGYIMRRLRVVADVHKKIFSPFMKAGKLAYTGLSKVPFLRKVLPGSKHFLGNNLTQGAERAGAAGKELMGSVISGITQAEYLRPLFEQILPQKKRKGNAEDILAQQDADYAAKHKGEKNKDGKPKKEGNGLLGFLTKHIPFLGTAIAGVTAAIKGAKDFLLGGISTALGGMGHFLVNGLGSVFRGVIGAPIRWLGKGIGRALGWLGGKLATTLLSGTASIMGPALRMLGLGKAADALQAKADKRKQAAKGGKGGKTGGKGKAPKPKVKVKPKVKPRFGGKLGLLAAGAAAVASFLPWGDAEAAEPPDTPDPQFEDNNEDIQESAYLHDTEEEMGVAPGFETPEDNSLAQNVSYGTVPGQTGQQPNNGYAPYQNNTSAVPPVARTPEATVTAESSGIEGKDVAQNIGTNLAANAAINAVVNPSGSMLGKGFNAAKTQVYKAMGKPIEKAAVNVAAKQAEKVIVTQAAKTAAKFGSKLAARLAITAVAGPLAPLVGLAMTLWTVVDIGEMIFAWLTSPTKPDDFRIAAYGINPNNTDHAKAILGFETWVLENGKYDQSTGKFTFPDPETDKDKWQKPMASFMGGKDGLAAFDSFPAAEQDQYFANLRTWYEQRFQPVFEANVNAMHLVTDGKIKLDEAFGRLLSGKLKDGLVLPWARRAKLTGSQATPYNTLVYPFVCIPKSDYEGADHPDNIPNEGTVEQYFQILVEAYSEDEKRLRQTDMAAQKASERTGYQRKSIFAFEQNEANRQGNETAESAKIRQQLESGKNEDGSRLSATDRSKLELKYKASLLKKTTTVETGPDGVTRTTISGSDVMSLDDHIAQQVSDYKIDELDAIRMRMYGLTKLTDSKVKTLLSMESTLIPFVKYDGKNQATITDFDFQNFSQQYSVQLGWNISNQEHYEGFTQWFTFRFVPVFTAYLTLIQKEKKTTTPLEDVKKFDKDVLYHLANDLLKVKVKTGEEEVSVWMVTPGPIADIPPNSDSSSVIKGLISLQMGIEEKVLTEKDTSPNAVAQSASSTSNLADTSKTPSSSGSSSSYSNLGYSNTLANPAAAGLSYNSGGGTALNNAGGLNNAGQYNLMGNTASAMGYTPGQPGISAAVANSVFPGAGGGGWKDKYTPPSVSQQEVIDEYVKIARQDGIDDDHIAMMLGLMETESKFQPQSEKLKYSVNNLLDIKYGRGHFGNGYTSVQRNLAPYNDAQIQQLGSDPNREQIIGNLFYGNRMGNAADEGYKYRGRGLVQLTGKENYAKYSKLLGVDLVSNPDLANDPKYAVRIAHEFAKSTGIYNGDFANAVKKLAGSANIGSFGERQANYMKHRANMAKYGGGPGLQAGATPAPAYTGDGGAGETPGGTPAGMPQQGGTQSNLAGNTGTKSTGNAMADGLASSIKGFMSFLGFKSKDELGQGTQAGPSGAPLTQPAAQNQAINSALPSNLGGTDTAMAQAANGATPGQYKWIQIAQKEMGVAEIPGAQHNPRILEYHASCGLSNATDELSWCSSFVNWVMTQAGFKGTNSAQAISWANWNGGQKFDKPCYGAIGVISWGGGKGHVGFVVGKVGGKIAMLGGNQGNMVKVSAFPEGKFIGFVLPTGIQPIYDLPEYKGPVNVYDNAAAAFADTRSGPAQPNETQSGTGPTLTPPSTSSATAINTQPQSVLGGYASDPNTGEKTKEIANLGITGMGGLSMGIGAGTSPNTNSAMSLFGNTGANTASASAPSVPGTPVSPTDPAGSAPAPITPASSVQPVTTRQPSSTDLAYQAQQDKMFNQYSEQSNKMVEILEKSANVQVEMRDHLAKLVEYTSANKDLMFNPKGDGKTDLLANNNMNLSKPKYGGVSGQDKPAFKMQIGNNPVTNVS